VALDYAREKVEEAVKAGLDIGRAIRDWLSADDKAREMVANGVHKVLGASERAQLVKTMMGGYCGDADEDAILTILRFSKQKGDLGRVMAEVGQGALLSALDGAQDTEARKILGI
jgi:hypothetical protein